MFEAGTKVLIEGNRSGVVRYYGPVDGKSGQWVGVELDFALGKHDGYVGGYPLLFSSIGRNIFVANHNMDFLSPRVKLY